MSAFECLPNLLTNDNVVSRCDARQVHNLCTATSSASRSPPAPRATDYCPQVRCSTRSQFSKQIFSTRGSVNCRSRIAAMRFGGQQLTRSRPESLLRRSLTQGDAILSEVSSDLIFKEGVASRADAVHVRFLCKAARDEEELRYPVKSG
jgi:hypothetical protein